MKSYAATALMAIFVASAALVPSAGAQSVQQLRESCLLEDGSSGTCRGFLRGAVDVMAAIGFTQGIPLWIKQDFGACLDGGITGDQAVQAFINWANNNPAAWRDAASVGVILSLRETFPCN